MKSKLLMLSALSGILLAASVLTRAQVSFLQPPSYSGNGNLFVGDFNDDSKVDLLTSDGTTNLGRGDGTFAAGVSVTVPSGLSVLAVADFNGDGRPDVLEQGTNTLLVLLGNGDGTFRTTAITTPIGVILTLVAAADLNGDRNMDLVGVSNSSLFVYLSNGDGTFASAGTYSLGATYLPILATSDFNGDNITDVAVTAAGQEIVLLGNGDGTFKAPTTSLAPYSNYYATAGDFNGDGRSDLAISGCDATQNCDIYTLLGNGDGTFKAPTAALSAFGPLVAADFNSDGKLDLVAYILQIFLGNGDGTFSTNSRDYLPNVFAAQSNAIAVADFNGDGKPDVAGWNTVLLNNGDGSLQANPMSVGQVLIAPEYDKFDQIVGDFDNNGLEDVAVVSLNTLSILTNNGGGGLIVSHAYNLQENNYGKIVSGDFNRDGNIDLIVFGNYPGGGDFPYWYFSVLLGNGDGSFQLPVLYEEGNSGTSGQPTVVVGDFNNDGVLDFAESIRTLLFLGKGDGTFAESDSGLSLQPAVSGDFNGDGKLDIASGWAGTAVQFGNGDGTFQTPIFPAGLQEFGPPAFAVDLNNDGKIDLVSSVLVDSSIPSQVALGNGDGTFTVLPPLSNEIVAVGDLNGDGKPDAYDFTQHQSSVMLGSGDGTFSSPINVSNGGSSFSFSPKILIEDMNGDDRPDLVLVFPADVGVILNTTPAGFELYATAVSPTSVTAGDSAISTVEVIHNFGFNKTVTLSCAGLPAGANCTFTPPFIANSSGSSALTITTTSSTTAGSYPIQVQGTAGSLVSSAALALVIQAAPDFSLEPATGSPTSQTITAGQSATFVLALSPSGSFTGIVSLSCATTPTVSRGPTCSVPSSVQLSGSGAQSVNVTVRTTAPVTARLGFPPANYRLLWTYMLLATVLLCSLSRKRISILAKATVVMTVVWLAACGGTSGNGSASPGTPAGTYTTIITSSSGTLSDSTTLTVVVQ